MKNKYLAFILLGIVLAISTAAVSRRAILVESPTQIVTGTGTSASDGTVTNTFSTAFGTAPLVFCTQSGTVSGGSNRVVSVTTSNFVLNSGNASVVTKYVAIGAP